MRAHSPWKLALCVAAALAAGLGGGAWLANRRAPSAAPAPASAAPEAAAPASAGALASASAAARVPIGASIGALRFVDARYLPRALADFGQRKAFVFVFGSVGCPIWQRYLPRLAEFERSYRERGVQFVAVNVDPADTLAEATAQAAEAGLDFPLVKDFTGEVVDALGVRRTPEVAVLDEHHALRYRGRIDDQLRLSGAQSAAEQPFLRQALDDLLAGRPVATPESEVEGCAITRARVAADPSLNWHDRIAPLFREHCRPCHQAGSVAPFQLWTYEQVRQRAAMIEEVVEQQRMPPWFAGSAQGDLARPLVLPTADRDAILAWLRAGAPRGTADAPDAELAPPARPRDWRIQPDLVLEGERDVSIPAEGLIPFQLVRVPFALDEDVWVDGIEIRPSNPRVMHHGFFGAQTEDVPDEDMSSARYLHMYVPGGDPLDLPAGTALRIPKGHFLWLQLHYVATGVAGSDRISIGLRFPRQTVRKELYGTDVRKYELAIPPGHPAFPLEAQRAIPWDITLYGAFPHMHTRGKDLVLAARLPDGARQTLLVVGNYSFDWQRQYRWDLGAKRLPKGSMLELKGRFDNSAFNPFNPDPTATVRFGQSAADEMLLCRVYFTKDNEFRRVEVDPTNGHKLQSR